MTDFGLVDPPRAGIFNDVLVGAPGDRRRKDASYA